MQLAHATQVLATCTVLAAGAAGHDAQCMAVVDSTYAWTQEPAASPAEVSKMTAAADAQVQSLHSAAGCPAAPCIALRAHNNPGQQAQMQRTQGTRVMLRVEMVRSGLKSAFAMRSDDERMDSRMATVSQRSSACRKLQTAGQNSSFRGRT